MSLERTHKYATNSNEINYYLFNIENKDLNVDLNGCKKNFPKLEAESSKSEKWEE